MTKLEYCYSHPKSLVVIMFWIVLYMFLNHSSIQHTPNPLFPSNFLLFFPNTFPNLFQVLHCFVHHKPRQFRPSLSPSLSSSTFSSHTPYLSASRMLCNTVHASFIQQRNAHSNTSFFNLSHIFDSLRSTSMRLSDERSLHFSIPHHTAAQPALVTKSYHCSQISCVFLNLLIGVCEEMPRSQWIAVCIDPIKKMIYSSPDGL